MSQEKSLEEIKMDMYNNNLRRRLEDVDYWRKRAGWFDDDESMREFNSGVYDTYYQADDDTGAHKSSGKSSHKNSFSRGGASTKGLGTFLKVGAVIIAVLVIFLLYRTLSRKSSKKKVGSSKSSSDGKHRSRSRSRSSRSRSRTRRASNSANYELMDDKSESKSSRKSSRSRSRSRRTSKTRKSRSRSKGRQNKEVLV